MKAVSLDLEAIRARAAASLDAPLNDGLRWAAMAINSAADVPGLLAEVERLTVENERLRAQVSEAWGGRMNDAELADLKVWAQRRNPAIPRWAHFYHAACPFCRSESTDPGDGPGRHDVAFSLTRLLTECRERP